MENEKVQKINVPYLLAYILVPILLIAACLTVVYFCFPHGGTMAPVLVLGPWIVSIIWWVFGGTAIYKGQRKKFEAELDQQGFTRNNTFYGRSCTVIVDANRGQVGLIFFWNPFRHQVVSAKRITKVWMEDGRGGAGIFEGSSRVGFLFIVDQVKIRVDTFTSNQRMRMDDSRITTGISKAKRMVEVLTAAKDCAN